MTIRLMSTEIRLSSPAARTAYLKSISVRGADRELLYGTPVFEAPECVGSADCFRPVVRDGRCGRHAAKAVTA